MNDQAEDTEATAIERVFRLLGSQKALATKLGISDEAVRRYRKRVPAERVLQIEAAVDGRVTRHELRPDLYPPEAAAGNARPAA